jgi:hypothetical protein
MRLNSPQELGFLFSGYPGPDGDMGVVRQRCFRQCSERKSEVLGPGDDGVVTVADTECLEQLRDVNRQRLIESPCKRWCLFQIVLIQQVGAQCGGEE